MKTRVTKEMIVEAGMMIVRDEGEEKLSVRNIASIIGCSTQPIMYCFPTMKDLRLAILEKANEYQTSCLTRGLSESSNIIVDIGMNYIHFAAEEKNLFKLLVMSDSAQGSGIGDLINSDDAGGLLNILIRDHGLGPEQARLAFEALFVSFHGYASLIANDSVKYDIIHCKRQLLRVYFGIIGYIKSGERAEMFLA